MTRFWAAILVLFVIALLRPVFQAPSQWLSPQNGNEALEETSGLPYYDDDTFTAVWRVGSHHSIGTFRLFDQTGAPFTDANLDGRVTVIGFFYPACDGICPQTVQNETRLQTAFADDPRVQLVSVAVTPETPDSLEAYAQAHNVRSEKWHLLAGPAGVVARLERKDCFCAPYDGSAQHSENLILVDGRRRLRGLYHGTLPLDVDQVQQDIRTLEDSP